MCIRVLVFVIQIGEWCTYTSVFSWGRNTDRRIADHTELKEVFKVILSLGSQLHLTILLVDRIPLCIDTANVEFVSPYIVDVVIFSSRSSTIRGLHLRNLQLAGIEHIAGVHFHFEAFTITFLGGDHDRSIATTGAIQSRSCRSFQHGDVLDHILVEVTECLIGGHTIYDN